MKNNVNQIENDSHTQCEGVDTFHFHYCSQLIWSKNLILNRLLNKLKFSWGWGWGWSGGLGWGCVFVCGWGWGWGKRLDLKTTFPGWVVGWMGWWLEKWRIKQSSNLELKLELGKNYWMVWNALFPRWGKPWHCFEAESLENKIPIRDPQADHSWQLDWPHSLPDRQNR